MREKAEVFPPRLTSRRLCRFLTSCIPASCLSDIPFHARTKRLFTECSRMSNYRGGGGGYRDRERDNSYRDSFRDRDRDWRDRERDRDGRRDPRYDDSRRRYDGHDGLERPLGDAYERSGDRRRPPRDYDRPPPRRFDRDERDYDRPARFGPPPGRFDGEQRLPPSRWYVSL